MNNDKIKLRRRIIKRLAVVLGAGIFVVIVAYLSVLVLQNIMPKKSTPGTDLAITSAPETVEAFESNDDVAAVFDTSLLQSNSNSSSFLGAFKLDEQKYTLLLVIKDRALFRLKEPTQSQSEVQSLVDEFMKARSYSLLEQANTAAGETITYRTYQNGPIVCQFQTVNPAPSDGYSHGFGCIDSGTINKEYNEIESLFALYRSSPGSQLGSFDKVSYSVITEGNKSLKIVRPNVSTDSPMLLFAAIDDNWEYIGDLNSQDAQVGQGGGGKSVKTPELEAALGNPKYVDFLTKNI